ncbi:DegV family protein [Columbia Basin potato purple top phytoplasma]|uniref:DegV family protein n=1 Tax=Columbia Basin potato purple top phytoplasma TaxID=307134 RepID=A0ABT5L8M9_9MOLU|nr:DegV family protein [Columbia Basin potato purple top phytoplasma]MDC9032004.1 DegV family protein [Columbia Basin potato purple top phytoplasma]
MNVKKIGFVVDSTVGDNINVNFLSDICVVPLSIIIDNKEFTEKIDNSFLLECVRQKKQVTTSQPSIQLFIEAFNKQLKLGYEHIVCVTISRNFSGTFNSAYKAKQILNNDNITIIDSSIIGPGMLFILKRIREYVYNTNLEYKEIFEKVDKEQKLGSCYFSLENLKQLVISKRISKFKFFIGSLLKIKPILKFQKGLITIEKNVRLWKNYFLYLIECILKFKNLVSKPIEVQIMYVQDDSYLKELTKKIQQLNDPDIKVSIYGPISPILAIHLGSKGFGFYLNILT